VAFGITLDTTAPLPDQARECEALGFDYLASGEHLFFHTETQNALINLAAAAGATSRVRLVSTVSLLPLYPAALAAKLVAAVDRASGGRFEFGVGAGGEYPPEFQAAGVAVRDRFARLDEGLEILRLLLAGERCSFSGRFTKFEDVQLGPPPIQQPVPVWLAGRRRKGMLRAARHADVWLPYMVEPDRFARGLQTVRSLAAEYGRPEEAVDGGVLLWTCVDADGRWARRQGIETISRAYHQDFEALSDKYLALGTPDEVVARIHEFMSAGATRVIIRPAASPQHWPQITRTLATEVLPALRAAPAARPADYAAAAQPHPWGHRGG
jgi:alkanesulfonate monooxygenase SsuD/methylene tetrahydromethanopterin reductase-like flavin-dependent oxidoreductase (luciferase family)